MKIWAPRAKTVELVSGARRVPAQAIGDGYWEAPSPRTGADYSLSLDGGPPRPDPRSRSQPHGVHGPSRWVEHPCEWTDSDFRPTPLAQAIFDPSEPHVLAQLAQEVKQLERPAVLIAENEDNDPRLVTSQGLDAFWFDDLHHAIHAAFTGERQGYYAHYGKLTDIATALLGKGELNGRPLGPPDGRRCVACIQNHDQIGNRARGERLTQLISPGRARLAAALMFTSPFVPLLFQGEEWAASAPFQYFTDHQDPGLARAVSEGRRKEHASVAGEVPDPQDAETMARSRLDWSERSKPPHREMLEWYRSLIALRHRLPELTDGRREQVQVSVDEAAGLITVKRGRVTLMGNIGNQSARVPTPPGRLELCFPLPAGTSERPPTAKAEGDLSERDKEGQGEGKTVLPPDSCALWLHPPRAAGR